MSDKYTKRMKEILEYKRGQSIDEGNGFNVGDKVRLSFSHRKDAMTVTKAADNKGMVTIKSRDGKTEKVASGKIELVEASYGTQQDYFDAQDVGSAVESAMDIVDSHIHEIEYDTSRDSNIPSSVNIRSIVDKHINYPKLRKDIEAAVKKAYKRK